MNSWISKLKASADLDRSTPPPRSVHIQPAENEAFRASISALDSALRGGPPAPETPPGLHASIMAAIRRSESPARPAWLSRYRWAIAACLLLSAWWAGTHLLHPRLSPSPFTAPASKQFNRQMATLPSTVLSPLSHEWEALNLDLQQTARFLLASVP